MTFDEYQGISRQTAVYLRRDVITYPALGLAGEAGEVANQVKKWIRDDGGSLTAERKAKILDEIGDCAWYLAQLCTDLGASFGETVEGNLKKLAARKEAGTIQGDKRAE